MEEFNVRRRTLILAGLAMGFTSWVPLDGLCLPLEERDSAPAPQDASDETPYHDSVVGYLSDADLIAIGSFADLVIAEWGFTGMDTYSNTLKSILNFKTTMKPSYLEEYKSAARIIVEARSRFSSDKDVFDYLMIAGRAGEASLSTRLGRARNFVFDELIRHVVANGGFRRFGLVNYDGYMGLPFTNPGAYRRASI